MEIYSLGVDLANYFVVQHEIVGTIVVVLDLKVSNKRTTSNVEKTIVADVDILVMVVENDIDLETKAMSKSIIDDVEDNWHVVDPSDLLEEASNRRVVPSSEAIEAEVVFGTDFAVEIKQPIVEDYNAILISKFGGLFNT